MSLSTTKTRDYPKVDSKRGVNYLKLILSSTYSTTNEDKGQVLLLTSTTPATPVTITIAALSVPIGSQIDFIRLTANTVTFVAGSGVTLTSKNGYVNLASNAGATAIKLSDTNWILIGDLS